MDESSSQIERQIERNRQDLSSNLQELEDKVKSIGDWRHHTRENPAAVLALAFGCGVLLSGMVGRRSGRRQHLAAAQATSWPRRANSFVERKSRISGQWDGIRDALLGAAAGKVQEVLQSGFPTLRQYFSKSGSSAQSNRDTPSRRTPKDSVQGEGDYESADRYRRGVENYVEHADIEQAARNAEPADEEEAAELEAAEDTGRRGSPRSDLRSPGQH